MDQGDPEQRIADLEHRLAEQKRIAELEHQIAQANAAARWQDAPMQPPPQWPGRPPSPSAQASRVGRMNRSWAPHVIVYGVVLMVLFFGTAGVTEYIPSSAWWTSAIMCDSPYYLTWNTSTSSYKPGQSTTISEFQCESGDRSYSANKFAIFCLQFLLAALILGAPTAAIGLLRRRVRPVRR